MLTCGSLFSGGGGWEVGAMAAGIAPRFGVELNPDIAEAHRRNIPCGHFITGSVTDVDPRYLPGVDVLFSSPPCQAHSNNRPKHLPARSDDKIGLETLRYAAALKPYAVLIENVIGYARSLTFAALVAGLTRQGYCVTTHKINAADYGVPQSRRRLVIVATLDALHTDISRKGQHTGWYSAIADLIPALPETDLYPRHAEFVRQNPAIGVALLNGQNTRPTAWGRQIVAMPADAPSFTVPASMWKSPPFIVGCGPTKRLTPRAAARLQAFPDTYVLPENKRTAYTLIGNAVPPLLALRLVEAVMPALARGREAA